VAFVSMKGPYSLIGETFGKLYGLIGEKGYVLVGPPMGVYFNAPGQVPDEELLWELRSDWASEASRKARVRRHAFHSLTKFSNVSTISLSS